MGDTEKTARFNVLPLSRCAASMAICVALGLMHAWVFFPTLMHRLDQYYCATQFNTALMVALGGLLIVLTPFRFSFAAVLMATPLLLISGLSAAQYFSTFPFHIDQVFVQDFLRQSFVHPGRPSVFGIVCFITLGGTFVITHSGRLQPYRPLLFSVLSTAFLAWGLSVLLIYTFGLEIIFAWPHSTVTTVLTAVLFLLLGIALANLAWHEQKNSNTPFFKYFPVPVLTFCLCITLILWVFLKTHRKLEIANVLESESVLIKHMLRAEVENRFRPLIRLSGLWTRWGPPDRTQWTTIAPLFLRELQDIDRLMWIDSTLRPIWASARKESGPHTPFSLSPNHLSQLQIAMKNGDIRVASVKRDSQPHYDLRVFVPVFSNNSPPKTIGFVGGDLRLDAIIETFLPGVDLRSTFGLSQCNQALFFRQDLDPTVDSVPSSGNPSGQTYKSEFSFYGIPMCLEATWATARKATRGTLNIADFVLFIGMVLTVLLTTVMYFFQRTMSQSEMLKGQTSDLERAIAQRKTVEEHLKHAEKLALIGTLVAEIAHDVATPLNVISARAELAMRRLQHNELAHKDLGIIVQQIDRTTRLFRDLLDFSKRRNPTFQMCEVSSVVEKVVKFLQPQAEAKNITIEYELAKTLPAVHLDPDQIQQVLINVIINAIQSSKDFEKIKITVSTDRNGLRIAIADSGEGIAPKDIEKIFEPFFSARRSSQGTGLGLAICQQIVRNHGGEISVESVLGKGTTFFVHLPYNTPLSTGTSL